MQRARDRRRRHDVRGAEAQRADTVAEAQNCRRVRDVHESQRAVMILQTGFEDAAQNKALQHRLQRAVTDRTRNEKNDAIADPNTEIERQDPSQDDAAAARLQHVEIPVDHIDQIT